MHFVNFAIGVPTLTTGQPNNAYMATDGTVTGVDFADFLLGAPTALGGQAFQTRSLEGPAKAAFRRRHSYVWSRRRECPLYFAEGPSGRWHENQPPRAGFRRIQYSHR